jgi:hypothetical protein
VLRRQRVRRVDAADRAAAATAAFHTLPIQRSADAG